jgi:NAD-dependent SIR2 family protein deacetylase
LQLAIHTCEDQKKGKRGEKRKRKDEHLSFHEGEACSCPYCDTEIPEGETACMSCRLAVYVTSKDRDAERDGDEYLINEHPKHRLPDLISNLIVTPTEGMPCEALRAGAKLFITNQGGTAFDQLVHLRFHERIGDVLPKAVSQLKRLMGRFK